MGKKLYNISLYNRLLNKTRVVVADGYKISSTSLHVHINGVWQRYELGVYDFEIMNWEEIK